MNDESLRNRLRAALDAAQDPEDEFVASLHDDLARRLGLAPVTPTATSAPVVQRSSNRSYWLVLAATLALLVALLGTLIAAGALQNLLPRTVPVLRQIQIDGKIRVAIRPDLPQAAIPGGTLDGFDIRVADEIASRLGVEAARSVMPLDEILSASPTWQVGLPSQALDPEEAADYHATTPYYFWPHYVVVAAQDPASSISDLAGQPVCAARGNASSEWLTSATLLASRVLEDEAACLKDVNAGGSRAFVSDTLLSTDFASNREFKIVGDQPAFLEPRSMLVPRTTPGGRELVAELDRVVAELQAEGTLGELSRTWFGGQDLTR